MIILDLLTQIAYWQDRVRSRRMLRELDAHLRRDIGLTEEAPRAEANKPWWAG